MAAQPTSSEPATHSTDMNEGAASLDAIIALQHYLTTLEQELGSDLVTITRSVTETTAALIHADGVLLDLIEGDESVCHAVAGIAAVCLGTRVPRERSPSGWVVPGGQPFICADTTRLPHGDLFSARTMAARSFVTVPLTTTGDHRGALTIYATHRDAFTAQDVRTLQLMAGFAHTALHHATIVARNGALLREVEDTLGTTLQQEQHYRQIVDHCPEAIALYRAHRCVYANPAAATLLGIRDQAAILGQPLDAFTHADSAAGARRLMETDAPRPATSELRDDLTVIRPDGQVVIVEAVNVLTRFEGQPTCLITFRDITAQKAIAQTLYESELQQSRLVAALHEGIVYRDAHGQIVQMNPHATMLFGGEDGDSAQDATLDPQAWARFPDGNAVPPEDYPDLVALRTGIPQTDVVLCLTRPDETCAWVIVNAQPLFHPGVTIPSGVVASYADITARKQAEEALAASERRFRAMIEHGSFGVSLLEANLERLYYSANVAHLGGYTNEEYAALPFSSLVHPDDYAGTAAAFRRSLDLPGVTYAFEFRVRHKDGTWPWIEVVTTNLLDDPDVGAIVNNIRYITERKEAEQALRASERRFRAMIENSADGIVLLDNTATGIHINTLASTHVLGYTREEFSALPVSAVIHPDDLPARDALWQDVVAHPGAARTGTWRRPHRDGSWRWTEDIYTNFLDDPDIRAIVVNIRDVTERKEAEDAVAARERRFRAMLEPSMQGIVLFNAAFERIYVSPSIVNVLGYSLEEYQALPPVRLSHPDDYSLGRAAILRSLEAPYEHAVVEMRNHHRDGSWRWLECTYTNLLENPDVEAIVATFRDITERKQAEEALAVSERRFRAMIEHSSDAIFLLDASFVWHYASPSTANVLGVVPTEPYRVPSTLVHPEDQAFVTQLLEESHATPGTPIVAEYRVHYLDGTWRWVEATITNLLDDPDVASIVLNYRDITARKEAERERAVARDALAKRERRFRAMIEHSSDAIVLLNHAEEGWRPGDPWEHVYVSPSVQEVLGLTPEEYLGYAHALNLVHPEDWPEVGRLLDEAYTTPGVPLTVSYRLRHADGRWRWIEGTITNLRHDAAVGAVITNQRDITERKRREEEQRAYVAELERSNRELADFASVTSHDLKEPLRKILAFGSRLQRGYTDAFDEKGRDFLDRMLSATRRMDTLIEDLLTYSRVATRTRAFKSTDLSTVVAMVASDLETRIEELGATVAVGPLPIIDADPTQMRQLWQNLLSNALKFHKPEVAPHVQITARTLPPDPEHRDGPAMVELRIADNGIGFDEKYLDKIFTMFERLHATGAYEGSGIGLAICRRIVERHDGTLTATSTPGEGATFIVTLPIAHEARPVPGDM